jgi:hypothetical protein
MEDDVQSAERRGAAAIFTFRRGERWEEVWTNVTNFVLLLIKKRKSAIFEDLERGNEKIRKRHLHTSLIAIPRDIYKHNSAELFNKLTSTNKFIISKGLL